MQRSAFLLVGTKSHRHRDSEKMATMARGMMEWRRDSFPFSSLARKPHAWAIDMNDLRLVGPETEGTPSKCFSVR